MGLLSDRVNIITPSKTVQYSPIEIGANSARRKTPGHTTVCALISTSPIRVALGETQAVGSIFGTLFRYSNNGIKFFTSRMGVFGASMFIFLTLFALNFEVVGNFFPENVF